jgi:predicted phosphodiesterase
VRLALISDIHGNAIALDAVVAELRKENISDVVCLGDVAATGPQPSETVQALMKFDCPVVMGNADDELVNPETELASDEFMRRIQDISRWCADRLTPAELDYLGSFAPTLTLELDGGRTLLCYHGSPASFDDVITPGTADARLDEMLGAVEADVMVGGHTHFPMLRRFRRSLVVNPGAVGLAYDRTAPPEQIRIAPWAEYAVLTSESHRVGVEFRRTPYDPAPLIDAARANGMPHTEWWVTEWAS